jgi:hypothetical protein
VRPLGVSESVRPRNGTHTPLWTMWHPGASGRARRRNLAPAVALVHRRSQPIEKTHVHLRADAAPPGRKASWRRGCHDSPKHPARRHDANGGEVHRCLLLHRRHRQ